jgi:hypothetical protein
LSAIIIQEFLPGVTDTNKVRISEVGGSVHTDLHVKNADKVTLAPRIDAHIRFQPLAGNTASIAHALMNVSWERDPFPAMEIYRIGRSGRPSVVVQDPSGGVAGISLNPFGFNHTGEVVSEG